MIQRNCYDLSTLPRNKRREWTAFGGREGIVFLSRKDGKGWEEELRIKELPEQVISLESARSGEGEPIDLWAGFRRKGGFRARLDSGLFSELLRSDSTYVLTYGELLGDPLDGMNLTPFIGGKGERKGLPPGPISFCPLKDRMLATTDSGLYRIDETAQGEHRWVPDTVLGCLFGKCSARKGKKVKEVFQFWEGEEGSIWVQARQPYHLLPDTDGEYHIDSLPFKGLGLGTIRSIYPDSNGVTWIGGDNGVVRYDEKVPKNFERSYSCMLTEVTTPSKNKGRKKNDSALFAGYYRKPAPNDPLLDWKRSWEQPEAFVPTLPYELNALTFHFAAPYYEKQEKVTYSYFLKGFDERWSEWKKETRKEYTNLPEGTYTFKVKAKNIYGVESSIGEYRFRVLPPWYRTWPAYGGYGIAGIGMVWLLLWLNSRRLVAQKQRLESLVDERTKEIREKNERLETANEEIQAEKEKVEEQKEKVEEAHQEITASIDYAQKIQNALLRSEEYASDHLPEHFILFKPQATVSGDFYWAKERNGHLYLAAIDCTGHGVPGAFMSMLGISQLNEIMAAKEWPSSGEVLTELRERVVAELQSGDPEGGAKDGMDAAMVKIPISGSQNPDPKRIEFAGANNPLYVVKEGIGQDPKGLRVLSGIPEGRLRPFRKSPDGIEIKGDKMAVGYEPDAAEAFTTAELEVPPGAMLYLFSDGYADQFGGPKGKKFRYGPFKELLARIHTMSPEEQKAELDRVFEEWKGGQEQVDDVCVVGVRV